MATHKDVLEYIERYWKMGMPASGRKFVKPAQAVLSTRAPFFYCPVGKPKCHMCGETLTGDVLLVKTARRRRAVMCTDLVQCQSRYVKNKTKIEAAAEKAKDEQVKGVVI